MKRLDKIAAWVTLGVASVSLTVIPVKAADKDDPQTGSQVRSEQHKGLGQLERANKLVGKEVISSDNQKLGKIDNIVVDLQSGRILYAVVGSGGVLGAGEKKRALAPGVFQEATGDVLHINMDKSKFETAPMFTKEIDKDTELGKATFVNQVYQHCGQSAWWQGPSSSASTGEFNNTHKVSDVIGMKIKSVGNEDVGKVDNLMLNLPQGRVAFVILDPDRSLGVGNEPFALPPDAFTLSADRKTLTSSIDKNKLASAPKFGKDWEKLSDPTFAGQVYQYYGKQAYFQPGGSGLEPTGREKEQNKENQTDKPTSPNP